MRIILVRHAAAVDQRPDLDDRQRALTPRGEERLRQELHLLQQRLGTGDRPVVYASDALRSLQTAQILADVLGLGAPEQHPFIYTGEYEALEAAVAAQPEDSVLILVGHEPWLSQWSQRMGAPLGYRKGGMADFERSSAYPLQARLLWAWRATPPEAPREMPQWLVAQSSEDGAGPTLSLTEQKMAEKVPSENKQPEARTAPEQLASLAPWRDALLGALKDLSGWRKALLKDPKATRPPHQLRVSARRARSLLSFLKPILDEESYQAYQSKLRHMMRHLAYVRELDVLSLERKALKAGEAQPRLRELGRALKRQRREAQAQALQLLAGDDIKDQLRALRRQIAAWDEIDMSRAELAAFEQKRLAAWQRGILKAWRRLDTDDLEQLHDLRLRLKKLNNVLSLTNLKAPGGWEDMPELKELQGLLGDICDTYAHAQQIAHLRQQRPDGALDKDAAIFTEHLEAVRPRLLARLHRPAHSGGRA